MTGGTRQTAGYPGVMVPHRSRPFRLLIGALASAGVVLAHALAYWVVAPDPHIRHDLLENTGHRYWTILATVALGLLAAGLAHFLARRLSNPDGQSSLRWASLAWRLLLLQSGGFLALEYLERVGMHDALTNVFAEPVVLIGLALQLVAALAGAGLLCLLNKAIDRFVERGRPRDDVPVILELYFCDVLPAVRFTLATGGPTWRGPPSIPVS